VIRVFENDPETATSNIFLDITSEVDNRGNEEGLLGLAFHPEYPQNGHFFVNYTTFQSTTRISRFEADPQNQTANPASELVLLEFNQPFSNHNGGQLAFGTDGYLYIAA
jgi:glucose/arabinose dehydrogenase